MARLLIVFASAALCASAALSGFSRTGESSAQTPSTFSSRVVATGLKSPWEIVWGPDGHLWVTERIGRRVVRVNPATGAVTPAATIDESYDPGRAWHEGLLGLALHPQLLKGAGLDFVYLAYTYDVDPGPLRARRLKVRRYTYDAATQTLTSPVDLLTNLPAHDDHGGGRLAFGPDQKLYLTRGDNGANWMSNACLPILSQVLPSAAQIAARDWSAYPGKILRMNLDGSVPDDNPLLNGVRSHIYSYGHRNPQGLQFGPSGLLYSSEHGPGTDDELNLVVAGGNYGWPHVAGYRDDRGYVYANWSASIDPPCTALKFDEFAAPGSVPKERESAWKGTFTPPMRTFFTVPENYNARTGGSATIAASGFEVYAHATGIAGWANSILQASLTRGRVYRVKLGADGRSAVGDSEELFRTANRYRDIAIGPDGRTFYLATDENGFGSTVDLSGARITTYANPGAILEFKVE